MTDALDRLPVHDRDAVLAVVSHLDQASTPLPPEAIPPDPALRRAIEECLQRRGRTLVVVGDPAAPSGWTSGYADDVADRLTAEGLGVLPPELRAVLALVLLHCVAAPTARGQRPEPWSSAPRVEVETLTRSRGLTDVAIRDGLRQLHEMGLVRHGRRNGVAPGPALDRLTPARRERLEYDLLAAAAPDDPVIGRLLARHTTDEGSP